jgi:hypothetical protein
VIGDDECIQCRTIQARRTARSALRSILQEEDQVPAAIEKCTSQVPSSVYLALALTSMAVSLGLHAAKKEHQSLFIGQWAAPFLLLGIYNKLVKIHGSDATGGNEANKPA